MLDRAVLLACQPLSAVALRQTRKVCTTLKGQHQLLGGQFKHTTQCILAQRSAPAISASRTRRNFSSTWGSAKPTDFDKLTPIDREKALFHIKRKMGASYSKGRLLMSGKYSIQLSHPRIRSSAAQMTTVLVVMVLNQVNHGSISTVFWICNFLTY